ncbi:MAG: M56 family metallopeptidase [Pirellulales bacterium]
MGVLTPQATPLLVVSPALPTAVALGIFRPTILLPQQLIDAADPIALRTILAHELAHIRHGDLLLLALCRGLFVLLWANPLFWLLRRRLRLDQETLADAAAAEVSTRHQYAEQLVDWAKRFATNRPPALAAAVGLWESPSQLRHRIAVLLDERLTIWRECSRKWRLASLAVCAAVAVGLSLVTLEPGTPSQASAAEDTPSADKEIKENAAKPAPVPMETLRVRVVDESGNPISSATVKPSGLRAENDGSHYYWFNEMEGRGAPETVTTGEDGFAAVPYPRYIEERRATHAVSLKLSHPQFVSNSQDLPVADEEHQIALSTGGAVEIQGFIEGQDAPLEKLHALGESGEFETTWKRLDDGKIRSPQLEAGEQEFRGVWFPEKGPTHFSRVERVNIIEGESESVRIELRPGTRLVGKVGDAVPRPVVDGKVLVRIDSPGETDWIDWTEIKEDGSFEFESLPRDEGEVAQLIAICEGFVSEPPPGAENEGFRGLPQTAPLGDEISRVVLAMIPTATCLVTLRDPAGEPVSGACVSMPPNASWTNGNTVFAYPLHRSLDFLRGTADWDHTLKRWQEDFPYQATSDEEGMAQLANVPPFSPFTINVEHPAYQLPIVEQSGRPVREVEAKLEPGLISEVHVTLEPKEASVIGGEADEPQGPQPADETSQPDATTKRNAHEIIGDHFVLCRVTTDLQRSLLGEITKPATEASLCVFVNGMAFTDEQIDAALPEFVSLADRLEELATQDNRQVFFKIQSSVSRDVSFDTVRDRAVSLSELCELLGRGAGYKSVRSTQAYKSGDFNWADFVAKADAAAESAKSAFEDSIGDERIKVFPVRTFLSRLLVDADGVVLVAPVLQNTNGNRFPEDFVVELQQFVPQLTYEKKQTLLFEVRYVESAKDRLEAWVKDREGLKAFAEQLGFENCQVEQSMTAEPAEAPKAADPAAAAKSQPNTIDPSTTGTLVGRFVYDGTPPKPKEIPVPVTRTRDGREFVVDEDYFNETKPVDESLTVGDDGGIANVFVWVRSKDIPTPPATKLSPVTVSVKNGRYVPHALAFESRASAPREVVFKVEDGVACNFHYHGFRSPRNVVVRPGEQYSFKAEPEPIPVRLSANLHPWLNATLFPVPNPYFGVSDNQGTIRIENLPPGEWEFVAWHERVGYLSTENWPRGRFKVAIKPGENDLGTIKLAPAALQKAEIETAGEPSDRAPAADKPQPNTITGRCVDEQGQPLGGVKLALFSMTPNLKETNLVSEVTTGADGTFRFEHVVDIAKEYPDGLPERFPFVPRLIYTALARSEGRATAHVSESLERVARSGHSATLRMPPAATLRGKVTDADGQPVAGVQVSAGLMRLPAEQRVFSAVTDRDGHYEIGDLEPLNREEEQARQAKQLEQSLAAKSTATGTFVAANRVVTFSHPDYATKRATYEEVPGEIDVQLQPAAVIEGRVTDANGKPVAEALVRLMSVVGQPIKLEGGSRSIGEQLAQHYQAQTRTDDEGRYRFDSVPANGYRIRIEAPKLVTRGVDELAVEAGEQVTVPDIKLTAGGRLRIQCVDAESDEPIAFPQGSMASIIGHTRPVPELIANELPCSVEGVIEARLTAGEHQISIGTLYSPDGTLWRMADLEKMPTVSLVEGETAEIRVPVRKLE